MQTRTVKHLFVLLIPYASATEFECQPFRLLPHINLMSYRSGFRSMRFDMCRYVEPRQIRLMLWMTEPVYGTEDLEVALKRPRLDFRVCWACSLLVTEVARPSLTRCVSLLSSTTIIPAPTRSTLSPHTRPQTYTVYTHHSQFPPPCPPLASPSSPPYSSSRSVPLSPPPQQPTQ